MRVFSYQGTGLLWDWYTSVAPTGVSTGRHVSFCKRSTPADERLSFSRFGSDSGCSVDLCLAQSQLQYFFFAMFQETAAFDG